MITLREAAQQALEAMEYSGMDVGKFNRINAACQALRAALAEPVQDTRVAERERIASQWDGCVTHQLDTFGPVDIGASIRAGELVEAQEQAEPVQEPVTLKRGLTGRCTRKVCECEKEGFGLECIYLEPMIDGYPLWSGIPKAAPVQKPVAWRTFDGEGWYDYLDYEDNENYAAEWAQRNPRHVGWVEPLYTAPPKRKQLAERHLKEGV